MSLQELAAAWPDAYFGLVILFIVSRLFRQEQRLDELEKSLDIERKKSNRIVLAYNQLRDSVRTLVASNRSGQKPSEELLQRLQDAPLLD